MSFEPIYHRTDHPRADMIHPAAGRAISGNQYYPEALWREHCSAAWVGVLYLVLRQRPVNWNQSFSSRYDGANSIFRKLQHAMRSVERQRTKGTSWTIRQVPCLSFNNSHGTVVVVPDNNDDSPFQYVAWDHEVEDGADIDYEKDVRLDSIINRWVSYTDDLSFSGYVLIHTERWECRCGHLARPSLEGGYCVYCKSVLKEAPDHALDGEYTPAIEPLRQVPLRMWHSEPQGAGYMLGWWERSGPHLDLTHLYRQTGVLATHLSAQSKR